MPSSPRAGAAGAAGGRLLWVAVKPFLLLAIRAEDAAADDEYASILRLGGLDASQLHRSEWNKRRWAIWPRRHTAG